MEEKAKMLGIPLSKLEEHGVVSHFTAEKWLRVPELRQIVITELRLLE